MMGNWDLAMLDGMPKAHTDIDRMLVEIGAFWAGEPARPRPRFMRSFVPTLTIELEPDITMLAFHGSPRSHDDFIFATTPDEELALMLGPRARRCSSAATRTCSSSAGCPARCSSTPAASASPSGAGGRTR